MTISEEDNQIVNAKAGGKIMTLLYYHKEKINWFPESYGKPLTIAKAEVVFKKLCRHFKLFVTLRWVSGNRHPKAFGTHLVLLNYENNNFGILCHELAHILHLKKYHKSGHNKKHKKCMKTIISYCKRKNWFEDELERRTAPKPMKPEPSKDEIREKRISQLEDRKKSYERKIRLAKNRIKKFNRQISALKRFI